MLVRSDGRPTYNFASPMEDVWDGITHVIRGDDHISNTPKQLNIIRAVGADVPVYAHSPMLFGTDGKKLSKRHGAQAVEEFRDAGYLPETMLNFLALLGWAPDGETTVMSRDELIERFTLERVSPSPAQFDYAKLDWMNGVYIRELPAGRIRAPARPLARRERLRLGRRARRAHARRSCRRRSPSSPTYPGFAGFFFQRCRAGRGRARRRGADARGGRGRARLARAVRCCRDRGGAAREGGRARPEAAAGVPAHPRGGYGIEGLPGPVREHRAARAGDDAQPLCRRPPRAASGSGFGGASGSRARWNASHARRRKR